MSESTNCLCYKLLLLSTTRLWIAVGGVTESCGGKTGVFYKYLVSSSVWSVGEGVFRPKSSRVTAAARCRLSWKKNFKQSKAMLLRCSGWVWCIIHVKGSKHQQTWHSSTTCTSHPVQLQCTHISYYLKLNIIIVGCFFVLAGVTASPFCSQHSLSFCITVPSLDLLFGYC